MTIFSNHDVCDEAYKKYRYALMDLDVDYLCIEFYDDNTPYVLGYDSDDKKCYVPLSNFGLSIKDNKITLA